MDEKYIASVKELEKLCNTCIQLSNETHGREVDSWQKEYGTYIFAKLTTHAISIIKLLPETSLFELPENFKIWDISSIASLVRSLLESYNVFYYLSIDEISEEEKEFRYIIWNLHSETERLKMLKLINSDSKEIPNVENVIEDYKAKLEKSNYFIRLRHQDKRQYRRGESGIHLTNAQISERAGINKDYYRAAYKYLSSYVHTYPFSINQIAVFNADDPESLGLMYTMTEYTIGYLCLSIRDFVKIFPDQIQKFDNLKKTIKIWEDLLSKFGEVS